MSSPTLKGDPVPIITGVVMRIAAEGDAEELHRAYLRNRDHLKPWEPRRDETFFTFTEQIRLLRSQLELLKALRLVPWLLLNETHVIGRINLSNIVFGAFRSANLGYWIDSEHQGRGLATKGVALACDVAQQQLGLHRVEAGTLTGNLASQRVLAKAGFTLTGHAPAYLEIDGEWRDHLLFQRILHPSTSLSAS